MSRPPRDENDLIRQLRAATGHYADETPDDDRYTASYTGSEALQAIGSTVGAAAAGSLGVMLARHGPVVFMASLAAVGALGAGFTARSLGNALGAPQGVVLGYTVLVAVTGIVASVAINMVEPEVIPIKFD